MSTLSARWPMMSSPAKVRIRLLLGIGLRSRENRLIRARFSLRRFRDSTFACAKELATIDRKGGDSAGALCDGIRSVVHATS